MVKPESMDVKNNLNKISKIIEQIIMTVIFIGICLSTIIRFMGALSEFDTAFGLRKFIYRTVMNFRYFV